jgi:hypothetical protein
VRAPIPSRIAKLAAASSLVLIVGGCCCRPQFQRPTHVAEIRRELREGMDFDQVAEIVHRQQDEPSGAVGGLSLSTFALRDGERISLVFGDPETPVGLVEVPDPEDRCARIPHFIRRRSLVLLRLADFGPEHDADP